MQHRTNITNRIDALDALRGFALLGITVRHLLTRYNYEAFVYSSNNVLAKLDHWAELIDYHLFFGKAYAIFALLFGLSFFLQQKSRANHFFSYMSARLLVLLLLAGINSIFFPGGDILGLYAVTGFLVLPAVKMPSKWIFAAAIFFLLQPLEWIGIAAALLNNNADTLPHFLATLKEQINTSMATGSGTQAVWTNLTKGQLSSFLWALQSGRFMQTIGLVLLGFYLGKSGWLSRFVNEGKNLLGYAYIPLFILIFCFGVNHLLVGEDYIGQRIQVIMTNWINFCAAMLYILFFMAAYDNIIARLMPSLKYYGRMSLSNYIFQSVVGGFLLAPFGFDWAAKLSSTFLVLVFIIMVAGQIIFSGIWLGRYTYGPFELFWRRSSSMISGVKRLRPVGQGHN